MADATPSPEPTCDVDGTCYCPLTGIIDPLSNKYAMQLISIIGAMDLESAVGIVSALGHDRFGTDAKGSCLATGRSSRQ